MTIRSTENFYNSLDIKHFHYERFYGNAIFLYIRRHLCIKYAINVNKRLLDCVTFAVLICPFTLMPNISSLEKMRTNPLVYSSHILYSSKLYTCILIIIFAFCSLPRFSLLIYIGVCLNMINITNQNA